MQPHFIESDHQALDPLPSEEESLLGVLKAVGKLQPVCTFLPCLHCAVIPRSGKIFHVTEAEQVLKVIATGAVLGYAGEPTKNVVWMSRWCGELRLVAQHGCGEHVPVPNT